ncbi:class I SAM-dependent methyltransferase [Paenarthrobacter sp. NPDC057355]|uniref:class I SAM-dependent methyltransferase n=1 Tax=Paenarthrobacter sp. NPDC057355 TaxID=3346105 RepID=UPI003638362D
MTTTPERATDAVLQTLEGAGLPQAHMKSHGIRLYDQLIANHPIELPGILAAVRETSGPILELAPGFGLLSEGLSLLGREASTQEVNPPAPQPDGVFGCAVLGASYITLLEPDSRRTLFRTVNRCLSVGGRFLMTVVNADHRHGPETSGATISQLGEDSFVITLESRDSMNGARHVSMSHISFNEHGTYRSSACTSDIAFVSTELIEEELTAEGLRILERRPVKVSVQNTGIKELNLWVCAPSQETAQAEDRS